MRIVEIISERVWHGSPHKVERFSTDHIGTGEGNGRFGWGLYFTGTKAVAEFYQRSLARNFTYKGRTVKRESNLWSAIYFLYNNDGDKEAAKHSWRPTSKVYGLIDQIDYSKVRPKSYVYDVALPDTSEFLLWDMPLARQSRTVQNAITAILHRPTETSTGLPKTDDPAGLKKGLSHRDEEVWARWPAVTGEDLYNLLSHQHGSDKAASLALLSADVHGIKYLDGVSRDSGKGSYNYVVFDGALASIEARR